MTRLTFKIPYVLPTKNYSYLIPAHELKYDIVETKDDDETPPYGFPLFAFPFSPPKKQNKIKIEYKNVSNTGKEFSIFYTPEFDIIITIDSLDSALNKYKIHVEKKNKKTEEKETFFCLVSCEVIKGLFA